MIAGFETPTKGNLLLDDERINDLPPYKRSYEPSVPTLRTILTYDSREEYLFWYENAESISGRAERAC